MVSRFIAALACLCAVYGYLKPDKFLKGKFGKAAECGRITKKATGDSKIVGGQETEHGEYPWQVSLQRRYLGSFDHYCGGSILDETTIITAAHCIEHESAYGLQVVAGNHRLKNNDGTEQKVRIAKIIKHVDFDSQNFQNDIALLKLSPALDLSGKYARPVCLPSEKKEEPSGYATVTGWGYRKENGYTSNTLQKVSVLIISETKCSRFYKEYSILDHMLCAGYKEGRKDACYGDSGGPLVSEGKAGSSTLIGIVSWGDGCARAKKPGVYTQVSYFLDWISKNRK